MSTKVWKAIDLFAGVGGIRLGFEIGFGKKRFQTIYASEIDQQAIITYKQNFHDKFEIAGDITLRKNKRAIPKEFDICMAGFPCQAFSFAGKKQGFNDVARGRLFFDVIKICKSRKPLVIFCENVKGLKARKAEFEEILSAFREIGYLPFHEVLNSKDFGVAQNRERIYIVAFRKDLAVEKFDFPKPIDSTKRIRDIVEREAVSSRFYLSQRYLDTLIRHRKKHESCGHGFGYVVKKESDIASTIMCGGMGKERNLLVDKRNKSLTCPGKSKLNSKFIRAMTPREWARLQGFPEDFILPESITAGYNQMGNTVTVSVVAAIAKEIHAVLKKRNSVSRQNNLTGLKNAR